MAQCTRCYGAVADGVALTPCCGVWLSTNGDPPGIVQGSGKVTDVAGLEAEVASIRQDLGTLSGAHNGLVAEVRQTQTGHNVLTEWAAKAHNKMMLLVAALAVWDIALTVLRFH